MSPKHEREIERIIVWALAGATLIAICGQMAWAQYS